MGPTLCEMGERGDIIRIMQKALKAGGLDPAIFHLHDAASEVSIVGRVVDEYLTDEIGEPDRRGGRDRQPNPTRSRHRSHPR
ncbi:DUF3363 domain-containing protein [Rhizobium sp. SSA_523]|uniref:DUF3363 domain-containing protein n=1 Tax=Rhizobium sp. SSA_523 TaxID=2952477 RepID=UPI00209103E7|nr:DUF3363 domain-containing protein [Rhizobium sp. SSA_523]MCO5730562.1 DUF3363 domain-containing protein [Rhizobium sp. SSA_523]WKC25599.1 DUF3363 domain-containing protein [Rhizobium sp. SSA_523]